MQGGRGTGRVRPNEIINNGYLPNPTELQHHHHVIAPVMANTPDTNVNQRNESQPQDNHIEDVIIQAILSAKEALEKTIEARDERDIMLIDNLCSLVHGFDIFPKTVRRALAAQAVLIVIDERGKELIVHNEELDSFCVLIFGECEQLDVTKTVFIRSYQVGDAFGVCEPTTNVIRFYGHMVTKCENCAFLCVKKDDFYSILTDPANYPSKDTIRHRDREGNIICVSQLDPKKCTSKPPWSSAYQNVNPLRIILPDGHVITKATELCLLLALVDGYYRTDPEFIDDFLLLFRVFMNPDSKDKPPGMMRLCNIFLNWLEKQAYRDGVIKIILTWLSSYYHDFELNSEFSYEFFRKLESKLLNLKLNNQLHLLHVTLSTKSKTRHVTITRSSREQPLMFTISGGYEKNCGIFITDVFTPDLDSKIKQGDQILEVNGTNFAAINLTEAQKRLDMSTHLSLTVKYNPSAFNEMRALPEGRRKSSLSSMSSVSPYLPSNSQSKFTFSNLDQQRTDVDQFPMSSPLHSSNSNFGFKSIGKSGARNDKSKLLSLINSSKQFVRQIRESTNVPGNVETMSKASDNISDDQSNDVDFGKAKSNPDLSSLRGKDRPIEAGLTNVMRLDDLNPSSIAENSAVSSNQNLVNVLRVFNAANNESRYILVHEETTAREVVMVAVREFNLTTTTSNPQPSPTDRSVSSLNWNLYEVSVVPESQTIKQKCLSEQTSRLAERASLCSRFYIKNNSQNSSNPSRLDMGDDSLVNEILKENPPNVTLTSVNATLLAVELTLTDFDKFKAIEPQQFVYDTFFDYSEKKKPNSNNGSSGFSDGASIRSSSSDGQEADLLHAINKTRVIPKIWMREYQDFADISNREMFWVVCEILNEKNIGRRVKIVKHFIRVADVCFQLRNFNSMFAIISGLGHSCVSRLRRTFDKLKPKYKTQLETMRKLFDPSKNMSNYRLHLGQIRPPAIPLFPQIKKDLTFTKEGRSIFIREPNDTSDDEDSGTFSQSTIRRKIKSGSVVVGSDHTILHPNAPPVMPRSQVSYNNTYKNRSMGTSVNSVLINFAEIRRFTQRVRNVIQFASIPYSNDLLTNRDSQMNQAQIKRMHIEWQMRKRIRFYISETFSNVNASTNGVDQVDGISSASSNGHGKLSIIYDEKALHQRSLDIEPDMHIRPPAPSLPERQLTMPSMPTVQSSHLAAAPSIVPPSINMHVPMANHSPTLSKSSSLSSCSSINHHMPSYHNSRGSLTSTVGKFGTESSESLRKLRALSENVEEWRPFNGSGNSNSNRLANDTAANKTKGLVSSRIFLPPRSSR